jgi:hypothetical protein
MLKGTGATYKSRSQAEFNRTKSNLIPGEARIISKTAEIMTRNEKAKQMTKDMKKRKVLDMY